MRPSAPSSRQATQLAGGASKEAWAVTTADGRELLLRRAGGGVIHVDTLSLRDEFAVISAARDAGVRVPEPIAYLGDLDGREAFVMELVHGETIGRRIVKAPPPGLDVQMADELAKVHSIPVSALPQLPVPDLWQRLYARARPGRRAAPRDRARSRLVPRAAPARAAAGRQPRRLPDRQPDGRRDRARGGARLGVRPLSRTRPRTSRGRSSARGGSAGTSCASAASEPSSRTSSAMPS